MLNRFQIPGILNVPLTDVQFISDEHYGHERIIELARRPFTDAAEMTAHHVAVTNVGVPVTIHVCRDSPPT